MRSNAEVAAICPWWKTRVGYLHRVKNLKLDFRTIAKMLANLVAKKEKSHKKKRMYTNNEVQHLSKIMRMKRALSCSKERPWLQCQLYAYKLLKDHRCHRETTCLCNRSKLSHSFLMWSLVQSVSMVWL